MQRLSKFLLFASFSAALLGGCAGSGSPYVARIDKDPITLEDFEEQYAKNNGGWEKSAASSVEEREKFLDLLVRFRLKVKEAYDRGLLADSSVRNEMDGYEVTVASAYMLEKEIVEPNVRKLYERKKEEVRASHILFRLDPGATPQDTLALYEKAMKVRNMVPEYDFDTLAARYSEDPGVSSNKGDLGYFTAGRMVPEFEEAAYSLKVGEITPYPVRTQFGYHLIKLIDRQMNRGAVRVSHILRRFQENQTDSSAVKDSTWIIYGLLKGGMDFAEAAKRFSQDPGSGPNGGDIGFYERGRVPPDVEKVFYSTPLDSVPEPMKMPYGFHIFKITAFSEQPKFQDVEKDLRQQYHQNKYESDYKQFVQNILHDYHVSFDTVNVIELIQSLDSTKTPANFQWSDTLSAELRTKRIFTCQDRAFTVGDFISHVDASSEFRGMSLNSKNVQYIIERMSEGKIVDEHARQVPKRYPAFSKLLKEYQDGILLYRIEQDEVWKKVVVNDSLLKLYHDSTKTKYRWPDRVNFAEIFVTSDSLAQVAYNEVTAGADFGDVAEKYTMRAGYKEKKGVWGMIPSATNELTRRAAGLPVDSIAAPLANSGGWSVIKVLEKDSARVKLFDEAKPELMSVYQEYASKARQEEWVAELKKQHPVVVNREMLKEAFKRKPVASN